MSFKTRFNRLERLAFLIKRKRTGTAEELSQHLQVSSRTIASDIDQLREWGASIDYCKNRNSYVYSDPVAIDFKVFTKENIR